MTSLSLTFYQVRFINFETFAVKQGMCHRPWVHTTDLIEDVTRRFIPIKTLLFWTNIWRKCYLTGILRNRFDFASNIGRQGLKQKVTTQDGQFFKHGTNIILVKNWQGLLANHVTSVHLLDHFHNCHTCFCIPIDNGIMNRCPTTVFWQERSVDIHRKIHAIKQLAW